MHPSVSTFACFLLKPFVTFVTATLPPMIKSAALALFEPISAFLRRTLAPPSFPDPEAALGTVNGNKKLLDWPQAVVSFCFTSGIGLLSVPDQFRLDDSSISFYVMSVFIALAFSFVFMSYFIQAKHPAAAGVLELAGVLFAFAALFTALCIPLPVAFRWPLWIIFMVTVAGAFMINALSSSSSSAAAAAA